MSTATRTRFVEVPRDRLMGELAEIGAGVTGAGGRFVEGRAGREVVVDLVPPGGRAMVRVYTSLAIGESTARDCGKDAVRVVVGVEMPERWRPLEEGTKILRTAPQGSEDRVGTFLARLRESLRDAYRRARAVPACPLCGRAMGLREAKATGRHFYGCVGYPECKGTRNV